MRTYPLVELPGLAAIEAEKGEILVNPEKVTFSIGGKSHARGGTKMLAEEGSYILSKHLKLEPEVSRALGYAEKKYSPAQLSQMSPTQKYKDVMDSYEERYDPLAKKTAALMFEKNAARQDLIFAAQEEMKASKGMKNDIDKAKYGMGKLRRKAYQSGGYTLPDRSEQGLTTPPENVLPTYKIVSNANTYDITRDSPGYSTMDKFGKTNMFYRPFAGDPYFDIQQDLLKGGKMTKQQKQILGDRQARLSDLKTQFPGVEGEMIEREYAKYIQASDKIENDQFIDKFLTLEDGREIPLSQATEAQIDSSKGLRFYNKRTGKDDIVDYRDRQNQGFNPVLKYVEKQQPLQPLPAAGGIGLLTPPTTKPNFANLAQIPKTAAAGEVKKGLDHQSIINGVQMGLAALDLATVRTKPPYYDYRPSELAYTRFEPINTKQQERAFNIARESVENSNLPQQVKAAQLASMYGQMSEGVNQIDLNNYQGKLANDNRNIERFTQARNSDIQREQDANLRYVAEADRRNAQAAQQRQVYLDSIMSTWRDHVANRRDIRLVNQFSRNYDYNFNQEQVGYVPGQGVPPNADRLQGFQRRNEIDPRLLNAEGLRTYGFNQ